MVKRNKKIYLHLIIALSALLITFGVSIAYATNTYSWTGTWSSNFGTMWFTQSGNQVSCNYTWDGGTLTGTVSGNILSGTWYEPGQVGRFRFTMSDNGKSFTGTWGYGSSETGGSWNGTRVTPIAQDDTAAVDENSSVVINVLANDISMGGENLFISSVGTPAHGTAVIEKSCTDPQVVTVNSSTHPVMPSGLKTVYATMPVLKWNNITYWGYSYLDNRVGMCIVAYDSAGNIVKQWEKSGDRYLQTIYVDKAGKKVYFRGQYYAGGYNPTGIMMTFDELNLSSPPVVETVNSSTHPAMPSGLKTVYATMPVLKWNDLTYWGYSYLDNRVGMCIIAYDSAGNIVKKWEKSGDRYLQTIYVDTAGKKVYFRGQYYAGGYNPTGIMMTFDELLVSVEKIKYTPNTNYHGNDSFTYIANDSIGGASATVFITVIDKTPPIITIAPYNTNPTNQDIVVTASTNEGTLNAASHTFTQNGAFTFTATDAAGNSTSKTVAITNIDKTPPTTTASVSPEPNVNGWNKTDVTVTLVAIDERSGVASTEYKLDNAGWTAYQGAVTISSEGVHTLLYRSRDNAGNQEESKSLTIRIDKTSPTVTGAATTTPNGNGWYKDNVIVHFVASDSNSGVVSVTPDQVISSEGNNLSVTGSATDLAGNSAYCTVSGINIDKTSPVITAVPDPVPNANGWNNSDVTVHFVATDSMSGIESVTPDVTLTAEGAGQIVEGEATDLAGNSAATSITLNIDKTAPSIIASKPEPNANGWYNADVTVSFTAADELSGLELVTDPITLAGEGANQSVTGEAVDKAGNVVSTTVSGINIDKTKPTVVINSPTSAPYFTNGSFTVAYTAADSLSGIEIETATLDGSEVTNGQVIPLAALAGDHILTVTIKDVAGNENTASITFTVIIAATVDIQPDTLNLKSGGKENSITGYIEFPSGYDVKLIDVASVRMTVNGTVITAQASPTSVGDYDSDGVQDLMVKIDRQQVIAAIGAAGDVTVQLSGCLTDGRKFEGSDVVKAIAPGNGKK